MNLGNSPLIFTDRHTRKSLKDMEAKQHMVSTIITNIY